MNKDILLAWDSRQSDVKKWILSVKTDDITYEFLLKNTLSILFGSENQFDDYGLPDHKLITEIDNGDYQGTLIFIIGGYGYKPGANDHWYTAVEYGSCSGCDTIKGISDYDFGKTPTKKQADQYWTLCLHMMQKMRRFYE